MLGGKSCTLYIYQRGNYVFMDMDVNAEPLWRGMKCLTGELVNQYKSNKFDGYLFFEDLRNEGGIPNYKEFGIRYVLRYVTDV